ncbi:MAG TPA: hypothetical protein VG820_07085, partial [Fimbriimonadaceae bacterium]|nr:hypothetical protein [Fimbriimonadaceae bacterium]
MRKHHLIRIAIFAASLFVVALSSGETLLERNVQLIASPNVATDLKLTEAQVADRNKLFEVFQTFRDETVAKMQSLSQDKQEALATEIERQQMDLNQKLVALLTSPQQNRLMQIGIQQEGFVALQDDLVAKEVGLTPAQRAKVKTICDAVAKAQDDYQAAVGEALSKIPEPSGSDEAAMKAYQKKQEEVMKSMKP